MTLQALSQRAARMRRAPSQRTSRGPADSSSWSGTTPPSPTRMHAETLSSHTHTHTHRDAHTHKQTHCFMSKEPWYKEKNTKREEFPSAYIWSRFSSCYLSGGTQCSVVITGLLIFTVYFCIYYIWIPRRTCICVLVWALWGSQPCTLCFLSDSRLSDEDSFLGADVYGL